MLVRARKKSFSLNYSIKILIYFQISTISQGYYLVRDSLNLCTAILHSCRYYLAKCIEMFRTH